MAVNQPLFSNNAVATLEAPITAASASLILQTGQGALFPAPAANQQFTVWLQSSTATEAVICSNNGGDTLTVLSRGAEGTNAEAFSAGTVVEMRLSAGILNQIISYILSVTAALAGSAAQVFNVAPAIEGTHAVNLAQANELIEAGGSSAPAAGINLSPGSSPFTYVAAVKGLFYLSATAGVGGRRITRGGVNFPMVPIAQTFDYSFAVQLSAGDSVRVSYSGTPTAFFLPT